MHLDPHRRAVPAGRARVVAARPLLYTDGADAALDRPAHVRAGSGLVADGDGGLWVVQDDARHLAHVAADGRVTAVALPAGDDGRRLHHGPTKPLKADHEAILWLDGHLLLVGSGSTAARERWLRVTPPDRVEVVPAHALYAHLRDVAAFSGAELNLEGAVVFGDHLVLAQRGNGAATPDRPVVDALGWLPLDALRAALAGGPWPTLARVSPWSLGGAPDRLTFTDLAVCAGHLWALAAAEASPDTYQDGPVSAVALVDLTAGHTLTIDGLDPAVHGKPEGLAMPQTDRAFVVTDPDDPDRPAWLLEIVVERG